MKKTVLITGASSGIGRALAFEYARQGWQLILMARRGDLLQEIKDSISRDYPRVTVILKVSDVAQFARHMQDVAACAREAGGLTVAIANAGVGFKAGVRGNNFSGVQKTFDVNFAGAVATLEAAKIVMLSTGQGHLVGISSVAHVRGLPQSYVYCASKSALTTYLEGLACDLKPQGIAVTAIHPGFVTTPMTEDNGVMPWVMSAERAARLIYKAILNKKRRFVFPWQMRIVCWVMRLMPSRLYDFFADAGRKRAEKFYQRRE